MRAIFHIGSPKAGSTSIQAFLRLNRAALLQQGIAYENSRPKDSQGGSQFELCLAALSRAGQLLDQEVRRVRFRARSLQEQAQTSQAALACLNAMPARYGVPTAVFSSEHCMPWLQTPETVRAFHDMLSEVFADGVTYVMYLRHPIDDIASGYSESIRQGATDYPNIYIQKRLDAWAAQWDLALWTQAVGRDNVILRLLEPGALVGGDLITDFYQVLCGADQLEAAMTVPPRRNLALSGSAIVAMRLLNAQIPGLASKGGVNLTRRGLLREVIKLTKADPKFGLSEDQAAWVAKETHPAVDAARRTFFPQRAQLFTTTPTLVSQAQADEDWAQGTRVLAKLAAQLWEERHQ